LAAGSRCRAAAPRNFRADADTKCQGLGQTGIKLRGWLGNPGGSSPEIVMATTNGETVLTVPDSRFFNVVDPNKYALLVQRIESNNARFGIGASAGRINANHCILLSAEATNAGLVDLERNTEDRISHIDGADLRASAAGEGVSAFSSVLGVAVVSQH